MTKDDASRDLIKGNIFYTSLNEKIIEDVIDYSIEVEGKSAFDQIEFRTGACSAPWEAFSLSLSLAWRLLLQPLSLSGPRPRWKCHFNVLKHNTWKSHWQGQ